MVMSMMARLFGLRIRASGGQEWKTQANKCHEQIDETEPERVLEFEFRKGPRQTQR
jgi:hypothetical protein